MFALSSLASAMAPNAPALVAARAVQGLGGAAMLATSFALLNVSYFYNREVRESIGKVQALIEPVMTIVLGLILGWVMLSVLGPVYDTISKMKF